MASKKFDPDKDRAPLPFNDRICKKAMEMKAAGLKWQPHVGCFVWDPDNCIKQDSPFPNRIYFVLSIPRFMDIFGDNNNMAEKLVWLPTWHQVRLVCSEIGVPAGAVSRLLQIHNSLPAGEDLIGMYETIIDFLKQGLSGAGTDK